MSESCDPGWNFSISEFVFSHFIYFSYLIFFAPYILRIISFLSPLFLTTSLLSLAFLNFYYSFLEKLRRGKAHRNEEIQRCDDLGMYETLFGAVEFEEKSDELVKLEGKSEDLEVNSISSEKSEMEEECEKAHQSEEIQSFVDLGMYDTQFGSNSVEKSEESVKLEEKPEDLVLDSAVGEKVEVNSNSISGENPEMEEKCKKNHRNGEIQRFVDRGMQERESTAEFEEKPEELVKSEVNSNSGKKSETEEKRMENFLKILDEFEKMASNVNERKKPDQPRGPKPDKAVEKPSLSISNGSDAINGAKSKSHSQRIATPGADEERESEGGGERKSSLKAESSRALMAVNSYGSMRREKEWKRTLACKLFEERHNNADGGEGMDSLWETHEVDSTKNETKTTKMKTKSKTKKKIEFEFIEAEEEDDDGDEVAAPMCCLQALKLSTGKMNLGVGIPNLVKISKAIKGMGWLHSVSKHSKKVHNNNGDRY